ncbi:hypothetical protein [Sphingomonas sp. 28-62-20]
MIVTQIAHIIADYVVFLELTDEEDLERFPTMVNRLGIPTADFF